MDKKVRFRLLCDSAQEPAKAHKTDAGFDLYSAYNYVIAPHSMHRMDTRVSMEIPTGYYGMVTGRSGLTGEGLIVPPGTIDSGYRGTIMVQAYNSTDHDIHINEGDRMAQIIILPILACELVNSETLLSDTERGDSGFGSTGR